MLARTFHESDLLVAEIVRSGSSTGLGAADLAALVSTLVYEHRSSDAPPAPWFSSDDVRAALATPRRHQRGPPRPPSVPSGWRSIDRQIRRSLRSRTPGWRGRGSPKWSADDEMTGGDFVRTIKQLIDLLRQLAIDRSGSGDPARSGRGRGGGVPWRRRRQRRTDARRAHDDQDRERVGTSGPARRMVSSPSTATPRSSTLLTGLHARSDRGRAAATCNDARGRCRASAADPTINEFPIDLLQVRLDDAAEPDRRLRTCRCPIAVESVATGSAGRSSP